MRDVTAWRVQRHPSWPVAMLDTTAPTGILPQQPDTFESMSALRPKEPGWATGVACVPSSAIPDGGVETQAQVLKVM